MEDKVAILLKLIHEYIACAKYSCTLFREIYGGEETFLHAYKILKSIPKEGKIDGVYYNFHGRGCYFEYPDKSGIEVDFGPDGKRCDGFDFYRIDAFLKFRIDRFPDLQDENKLNILFTELARNGVIKKHPEEPNGHLYYLSNTLN